MVKSCPGGGVFQAQADAYIAAVEAEGVVVSDTQKACISDFFNAGWIDAYDLKLWLPVWSDVDANSIGLHNPGTQEVSLGNIADHNALGITGDGVDDYGEILAASGLTPIGVGMTTNQGSILAVVPDIGTLAATNGLVVSNVHTGSRAGLFLNQTLTAYQWALAAGAQNADTQSTIGTDPAALVATRDATNHYIYSEDATNGAEVAIAPNAGGGTVSSLPFGILCQRNSAARTLFSDATLGLFGVSGQTIPPADAPALTAAIRDLWECVTGQNLGTPAPAPFAINDLSPVLHLDASIPSTMLDATSGGSPVSVNSGVARWEDISGNANHVTQNVSGRRPLRRSSVQNGLDAIEADGVDDLLSINSHLGFTGNPDITVFLVGRSTGAHGVGRRPWSIGGPGAGILAVDTGASSQAAGSYSWRYNNGYNPFDSSDATSWHIARFRRSSGQTYSDSEIWINGVSQTNTGSGSPSSSPNVTNTLTEVFSGISNDGSSNFAYGGFIGHLVMYNQDLSDAQCDQVEEVLADQWGITLP